MNSDIHTFSYSKITSNILTIQRQLSGAQQFDIFSIIYFKTQCILPIVFLNFYVLFSIVPIVFFFFYKLELKQI